MNGNLDKKNGFLYAKAAVAALCGAFTAAFGWLGWLVLAWAACMVLDWLSGSAAAASRIRIITSLNWARERWKFDFFFFSLSLFSPNCSSLSAACWLFRPVEGLECSSCRTSVDES